jgi:uncharacterized membrane protein
MDAFIMILADAWNLWADLFIWLPYHNTYAACSAVAIALIIWNIVHTLRELSDDSPQTHPSRGKNHPQLTTILKTLLHRKLRAK